MKVRLLLVLVLVLLIGTVQIIPVSAQESAGGKWVIEYIDNPDEGREFRQELENNVGYETGTVNFNAGSVTYNYHKEKDGTVLHDYVIETSFDKPPQELIPGETIQLNISNRVVSNSMDIDVGARYYFSVRDSNAGELARADIDRSTPSAILTFQVPEVNNGELVIFFSHQLFHDLAVTWGYRAGQAEVSEEDEFSESDFDDLTEEYDPDMPDSDPYQTGMVVEPWGTGAFDWLESHAPEMFRGLIKVQKRTATECRGRIAPRSDEGIYVFHKAFNKWSGPLKGETSLYTGDIVITREGGAAYITWTNDEGMSDMISVGGNTALQVPYAEEDYPYMDQLSMWSLYKGMVKIKRGIFKDPTPVEERNPFFVRTPTVLCGSGERVSPNQGGGVSLPEEEPPAILAASILPVSGNTGLVNASADEDWTVVFEFIVRYDEETEESSIYALTGEVDYYNVTMAGEETDFLTEGESLLLSEPGNEYVDLLDREQWDALVSENNLGNIPFPDKADIEELLGIDSQVEGDEESGVNPVIIVVIVVVVVLIVLIGLRTMRSKAAKS